jgi:hypothetical protein
MHSKDYLLMPRLSVRSRVALMSWLFDYTVTHRHEIPADSKSIGLVFNPRG